MPCVEPPYDVCDDVWWWWGSSCMDLFVWYRWYECEWLPSLSRLTRTCAMGEFSAGGAMTVVAGVAGALNVGVMEGVGDDRRAWTDIPWAFWVRFGIWMWRGGSGRMFLLGARKKPSRGTVEGCESGKPSAPMAGHSWEVGREAHVGGGIGARERYDGNSLLSNMGRDGGARRGRGSLLASISRPKRSGVDEADELGEL